MVSTILVYEWQQQPVRTRKRSQHPATNDTYLAIFAQELQDHLVTLDPFVLDLGGNPALRGIGLPRPGPDLVVARHCVASCEGLKRFEASRKHPDRRSSGDGIIFCFLIFFMLQAEKRTTQQTQVRGRIQASSIGGDLVVGTVKENQNAAEEEKEERKKSRSRRCRGPAGSLWQSSSRKAAEIGKKQTEP